MQYLIEANPAWFMLATLITCTLAATLFTPKPNKGKRSYAAFLAHECQKVAH